MIITMLNTHRGSSDGFKVDIFEKGKTYSSNNENATIGDMLARSFINAGWAIEQEKAV